MNGNRPQSNQTHGMNPPEPDRYSAQRTGGYPQQTGGYPQQTGGYPQQTGGYPQQTGEQDTVRDWQKNTWYGPAPVSGNPFDEPEDAPELLDERSDSLTNREGDFWAQKTEGYRYGDKPAEQRKTTEKADTVPVKNRKWTGILIALAVCGGICAVLLLAVFRVRSITVVGNTAFTPEQVIDLSGIKIGMSTFSVDGEAAGRRIENGSTFRLQFRYVDKKLPGDIVIAVRERTPCCWMNWCGIMYVMDKHRMVLYENEDENPPVPSQLVKVNGLSVRSGCMVGQMLTLESTAQETVFSELFLEMRVLNCTERILEADLVNPYQILLTTRNGFTVAMGDGTNIHAKLRSMLLTIDELVAGGYSGGTINVVNPENPVYSPSRV